VLRVYVGRPLPVGVIAGALVAIILLIAIAVVVVLIVFIRRRRQRTPARPTPHVADEKASVRFPRQSTKPIALSKFRQHVAVLENDTNLEYNIEYEVHSAVGDAAFRCQCCGNLFVAVALLCGAAGRIRELQ